MKNSEKPDPLQDKGFPSNESVIDNNSLIGLTKREYFAAKALQGLLSTYDSNRNGLVPNNSNVKYIAKLAVSAADALLVELSIEDGQ